MGRGDVTGCMAYNMWEQSVSKETTNSGPDQAETQSKDGLNRRQYLLLGAATAATAIGAESSLGSVTASDGQMESYQTDFSDYAA